MIVDDIQCSVIETQIWCAAFSAYSVQYVNQFSDRTSKTEVIASHLRHHADGVVRAYRQPK